MLKKSESHGGKLKRVSTAAFTLLENIVACGVIAVGLAGTYTINNQCMSVLRMAKDEATASQILQQRIEHLRIANWQRISSPTWIGTNILNAPVDGATYLPKLVETVTITPYPGGGATNTFSRSGSTVTTGLNSSLQAQNSLAIRWTVTWNGIPNGKPHLREVVTVLGKGGIAK